MRCHILHNKLILVQRAAAAPLCVVYASVQIPTPAAARAAQSRGESESFNSALDIIQPRAPLSAINAVGVGEGRIYLFARKVWKCNCAQNRRPLYFILHAALKEQWRYVGCII